MIGPLSGDVRNCADTGPLFSVSICVGSLELDKVTATPPTRTRESPVLTAEIWAP